MRRREILTGLAATILPAPALARTVRLPRKYRAQTVAVSAALGPGEIHVVPDDFFLYWTLGDGRARRYGIAVGAQGRRLEGGAIVGRKAEWPSWRPTANMIRIEPRVYGPYAGGLPGGHRMNPMGARALYLHARGRDTMYRIHGTPQPWTIGQAFSSGCVRLTNDAITDLYARVPTGTRVWLH